MAVRRPPPVSGAAGLTDPAVRPALVLLTAWLLVTAVPLAESGAGPAGYGALVWHLVLVGASVAMLALTAGARAGATPRRSRAAAPALEWSVAWLPLVAVPALYAELPIVAAGLAGAGSGVAAMHDAVAIRWELALFGPLLGASPAVALARHASWTPLSELLHLAYLAYYVIIYVPPALLWWEARRRRGGVVSGAADPRAAFYASAFTVLLAFVLCYAVFVVFPVQGPWYTWHTGGPGGLPLAGPVRAFVQGLLVAGSSRGTAFPSSHVAVSVAQTVVLARVAPRLARAAGPATALLALGAVYGGYHYGVDALAGAALGAAVGWAGPRLLAYVAGGQGRERQGRERRATEEFRPAAGRAALERSAQ
ncbi:hypothetical protein tb265_09260 [Gemmatimonadetes bacterium T265]|nr:hypothetical protein tb265_09260 [Gemmatimonadetes bacterium T265]